MNNLNPHERDLLGNGKSFELGWNKRRHLCII